MSADPTRGISCPDTRRVVREALRQGWEWAGWTGTTHIKIVWPKTGAHLSFGSTPSVGSWKATARDIERASGIVVWRRGNRKRSHKAFKPSGFSVELACKERTSWHVSNDDTIEELTSQRDELIELCRSHAQRRGTLREIPPLLGRINAIELRLRAMGQPVETFDPFTLTESE